MVLGFSFSWCSFLEGDLRSRFTLFFVQVCRWYIFSDLLIQSLFSFFTLTTRDHLCSYERPSVFIWRDHLCPIHFSGFFEPVFRAALNLLSRVSPVSFLLFSNIFLFVYQYFFFADVFKSDIWTEFFASIPFYRSSHWPAWWDCACLTWRFQEMGKMGFVQPFLPQCHSTFSRPRFTCIVVLM